MPAKTGLTTTSPLTDIGGIGPHYQKILSRLNLTTVRDLLHHYPSRYLDYRVHTPIQKLKPKKDVSFIATLSEPKRFISKTRKIVIQVDAEDPSGKIKITWFNNPYISRLIKPGNPYLIAGKTSFFSNKLTLISPTIEPAKGNSLHASGLVPIYPLTAKLTSRFLRQKIKLALEKRTWTDPLNIQIIKKLNLFKQHESLTKIHFPKEPADKLKADERLAFNHHLAINLINQIEIAKLPPSPQANINRELHQKLCQTLPFKLTRGQIKAINDGYHDLSMSNFTHRLIQGETGSGKTIVVFFFAAQLLENQKSFCLLAPTEILATQHYQSFAKFGLSKKNLALVTSKNPLKKVPDKPTVFIGTHALLHQLPNKLQNPIALVVVDEQHKFGVKQRELLKLRRPCPHLINLTATPIPRTLALGLFGEVEITNIGNKPKNRLPVKTWVVNPTRFKKSDSWLQDRLKAGSKVFVISPLIHSSEKAKDLASTEKIRQIYQRKFGEKFPVHLIHGQLKPDKIEAELKLFRQAVTGILVSTTLIEVGIDIPEADVIIIHSAERFGLAQLHQLRGRVGRGHRQGYCLLVPTTDDQQEEERLKLLEKYHSGLVLAKKDLKLRGAGELFGEKQHGWIPVRLKNFWNKNLFLKAKKTATEMVALDQNESLAIANKLVTW